MRFIKLIIVSALLASFVSVANGAALNNLSVEVPKNIPKPDPYLIGHVTAVISDQINLAEAMLIDGKRTNISEKWIVFQKEYINLLIAVKKRIYPTWVPDSKPDPAVNSYIDIFNGVKGDEERKKLFKRIEDGGERINLTSLINIGFSQSDFDDLLKWDKSGQAVGGPFWSTPNRFDINTPSSSSSQNKPPYSQPKENQQPSDTGQILNYSHGKYVGGVMNGKAHGYGTYTSTKSGTVYTGQFIADTFSGDGTMAWTNGSKFVGKWQNDVGTSGTMTYANGSTTSGVVRNGIFARN